MTIPRCKHCNGLGTLKVSSKGCYIYCGNADCMDKNWSTDDMDRMSQAIDQWRKMNESESE